MTERRRFNKRERIAMSLASDGQCEECGANLDPGWHGDHVIPFVVVQKTEIANGQTLCPDCNLKKGSKTVGVSLLEWQQETLKKYQLVNPSRFLIAAFPGMGKTICAAAILASTGKFGIVLVPQIDSHSSWRKALHGFGLCPASKVEGDAWSSTCSSCETPVRAVVMSYDFAAANPHIISKLYKKHHNSLLILDEVHHLADEQAWSVPLIANQPYISSVLSLSATPFRSDEKPVPFVHTEGPWTKQLSPLPSQCISEYSYGKALTMKPPPVNGVVFERYDADVTWMDDEADEHVTVKISEKSSKEVARKARRHVLDTRGNWMPTVLEQANRQLDVIRQTNPMAGGLIICKDTNAVVFTADLLAGITTDLIHVYTQDYSTGHHKPGQGLLNPSGKRVGNDANYDLNKNFRNSNAKWIVTVRKISEGVDVPRLQVLVYATVTRTRLFFIQAVGRAIRFVRGLHEDIDQTAWVYVPDDEAIRVFAAEIEDSMAEAQIAALEEEEEEEDGLFPRQQVERDHGKSRDRFVSAEAEFLGATTSGELYDARLHAIAREIVSTSGGRIQETLANLSFLRDRGMLNIDSPSAPPPADFDPAQELGKKTNEKNSAVRSWTTIRLRVEGGFKNYSECIRACNTELGDLFGVWKKNQDVTVAQMEKATQYAREQIKRLRIIEAERHG